MRITFLFLLLLFSTNALVEEQPAVQEEVVKRKFVCKTTVTTGSRIPNKICLPEDQWEKMERDSREATERGQNSSLMINKEGG